MTRELTQVQADALAARLELDLDQVCHACLCFVSFALDEGEPPEIARELRRMTPDLWEDGLDAQALAAANKPASSASRTRSRRWLISSSTAARASSRGRSCGGWPRSSPPKRAGTGRRR